MKKTSEEEFRSRRRTNIRSLLNLVVVFMPKNSNKSIKSSITHQINIVSRKKKEDSHQYSSEDSENILRERMSLPKL